MTTQSPADDGVGRAQALLDRMYQGAWAARDELMGRLYPRPVSPTSVIQELLSRLWTPEGRAVA